MDQRDQRQRRDRVAAQAEDDELIEHRIVAHPGCLAELVLGALGVELLLHRGELLLVFLLVELVFQRAAALLEGHFAHDGLLGWTLTP
jgi:hypothetical protein